MLLKDEKKIEKRAKVLLLNKDIQSDKMEIINSLLHNKSLTKVEKYSAIIDITKFSPDKKPVKRKIVKSESIELQDNNYITISKSGQFVNQLFIKYKSTKLFRKRYLIHVNNRLGIGIQKRLIPSRHLIKALRHIVSFQEKIISRLPEILMEILKDETIEDSTQYNHLRIFRRWMMETPIIKYDIYELKWMAPYHYESELRSYIRNYYSFLQLDIESREQILLIVENKLRLMSDLKKEEIKPADTPGQKNEKEKINLKIEKIIFDYMVTLRSFLQPVSVNTGKANVISEYLKLNFNIDTFPEFLLMLMEVLVFQREISLNELISLYEIRRHSVSSENWDYSPEFLKEIGKDPESRKKRHLQKLKNELLPFDELYSFLKLRKDGQLVLLNAVETQWKIADKKQKDYSNIFKDDFLTFIDLCINFFNNTYVSLLNGSTMMFKTKNEEIIEGTIFYPAFFFNELRTVSNIIDELHIFKTTNPRLTVTHEETMKILQGKVHTMFEIERFILLTGDIFYQIGEKLQTAYDSHRLWSIVNNPDDFKLFKDPINRITDDISPIPFYNCYVIDFKDKHLLTDRLKGNVILNDSLKGGIFIYLNAFVYQLAYECLNDNIYSRLDKRKELIKKINEITHS